MKKLVLIGLVLGIVLSNSLFAQGIREVSQHRGTLHPISPIESDVSGSSPAISVNVHCNTGSNYLILEVYGLHKMQAFEITDRNGKTIHSGGIVQTQMIETSTWENGDYLLRLGNRVIPFSVAKYGDN